MSSAFYPLGMNSWNNRLPQGGYKTWKGSGPYKNPIGVTSTNIRPLTNNDYGNIFPTGFGLPRPMKHYRKGTIIKSDIDINDESIKYNLDRNVKSSVGASLSGGSGGLGMISQVIDNPGSTSIKENLTQNSQDVCVTCDGIKIISDWYPINNLTEKPQENVTNRILCCNQQRKAKRRVLGANTNVKKNYFQTTYMYLYNRCQTFQQREFNFLNGPINSQVAQLINANPNLAYKLLTNVKPGEPLSIYNQYVAQCNPNFTIQQGLELNFIEVVSGSLLNNGYITIDEYYLLTESKNIAIFLEDIKKYVSEEIYNSIIYEFELISKETLTNLKGCSQVYYKPNNPQFANQGAVSSSTRILKLNVDTISTNAYKNPKNIYKNKSSNTGNACINQSVTDMLKSYRQLNIRQN
jgi:hypothetical protein